MAKKVVKKVEKAVEAKVVKVDAPKVDVKTVIEENLSSPWLKKHKDLILKQLGL